MSFSTVTLCLLLFVISSSLKKKVTSKGAEPERVPSRRISDPLTSSADLKGIMNTGGSTKENCKTNSIEKTSFKRGKAFAGLVEQNYLNKSDISRRYLSVEAHFFAVRVN